MLKPWFKLFRLTSSQHIYYNLSVFNIQRDLKFYFSSNKPDNIKLTVKDLTPVSKQHEWDAPEITSVGDIEHTLRLSRYSRRHDIEFYIKLINQATVRGDAEKLISVLFHDMLVIDRVLPNIPFINQLLINLTKLGGHSEASFRILRKIKEIGVEPNMVTYSLIFKNCARELSQHNLYFNIREKGISLLSDEELEQFRTPAKKAFELWQFMTDKDETFPLPTINSLLLALNRGTMLKESCIVLDRFLGQGNRGDNYTLSAVIEGCLTDQRNGFGLAMLLFNKLSKHCSSPTTPYVITNLLKVASKCQFGSAILIDAVLNASSTSDRQPFLELFKTASQTNDLVPYDLKSIHNCPPEYNAKVQESLKSYDINIDEFIDCGWSESSELIYLIKSPTNMLQQKYFNYFNPEWLESNSSPTPKLVCLGGILGVLNMIKQCSLKPNIQCLTSLIKCLPTRPTFHPDFPADDLFIVILQKIAKHLKIQEDNTFKNAILKRRIALGINSGDTILSSDIDPYTLSVQAKNCKSASDVKDFFKLMTVNGMVADKHIMLSLLTSVYTWGARLFILEKMKRLRMAPSREIIAVIEEEIFRMRKRLDNITDDDQGRRMKELFDIFQRSYADWLDQAQIDSVNTGSRQIFVDDVPPSYKQR